MLKGKDPKSGSRWRMMQTPGGAFNQGGGIEGLWKDGKNKELAWQYLKWSYTTPEGGEAIASVLHNYIPVKAFIDNHDFTKDSDPFFGPQNVNIKLIKEMAATMKVRTPEVYQNQVYDSYKAAETAVINDKSNSITLDKYKELFKTELKNKCPDLQW